MPGKLLLVGTPIGNLDDLSPRALAALKSADLILCEDTRHTRKLLTHFGIERPMQSFHQHNEEDKTTAMIDRIEGGAVVALVSDAGMPNVSDPGFRLVRQARERKVLVETVPGPFAGILALAASGIPPLPFTFFGFTPHRQSERRDFYRRVAAGETTAIMYESPERVVESLEDAAEVLGNVEVTVAREMTKIHEEFLNGTIEEVLHELRERPRIRGEITLVFSAAKMASQPVDPAAIAAEFERLRASGMRRNDAIKVVAEQFGVRKNEIYRMLIGR